jgi:hypothetical protein
MATTTTISKASANARFWRPRMTSLVNAERMNSGRIGLPWLTRIAAVAYAANALANSSKVAPRKAGSSMGAATRRQYCHVLAPRFTAASRHCGRIPSRAGRKTITISGIWK